jgi:ribulose-5-phosphate 4-epimerase/fuculose-1-phosphate aldolase
MIEKLKVQVCQANFDLVATGLVIETWGNASGVDHTHSLLATAWAQAQRGLPSYGTTQATYGQK